MINFNRIGAKLGIAGLVGIVLAIAMVAVQMTSEISVREANQKADAQNFIAMQRPRSLSQDSNRLKQEVGKFLNTVLAG